MFKRRITLLLVCFGFIARSQSPSDNFKTLQLNSSPAYVILGVDPENIQRPNSPTDFVANVQSAVVNGRLQPNFAMETTPYFWRKSKKADLDPIQYITNQDYWKNLSQSITFSFATSPSDSFTFGSIPTGTGLGLGLHFQLFQGTVSKRTRADLEVWYNNELTSELLQDMINTLENGTDITILDDYLDTLLEQSQYNRPLETNSIHELQKQNAKAFIVEKFGKGLVSQNDLERVREIRRRADMKMDAAIANVNKRKYPLTREGFMMEFAFASAFIAEQNRWDMLNNAKSSIWLTPSYRFNLSEDADIDLIDLMGVGRITFNSSEVDSSNYFDGGFRLQWIHNNISLSGEGIIRYLTKKPETQEKGYTWRTDFSLSYKINDAVTFKATFGSNFDGTSLHYTDPKKMFAVGGFNFGFSDFLKK